MVFLSSSKERLKVTCCNGKIVEVGRKTLLRFKIQIRDHVGDQDLMLQLVPELIQIIHQERLKGRNVLVHCRAGVQRAPTVGTMYLNKYYYKNIREAISKVKKSRYVAFGNGYTFHNVLR